MVWLDFNEFAARLYADAMSERSDEGEDSTPVEEWLKLNDTFLRQEYLEQVDLIKERTDVK
tara:strand:+ start:253 stop:435 length:183 start_codon:yes stop_codon:yes gene_type:complete